MADKLAKAEWAEYRLGDLFEVKAYKKRFDANKVQVLDTGEFPYVVRMGGSNGVKGYINEDPAFLNEGNTISFGQDTATMFYQKKPYFTGDKIKILHSKDSRFSQSSAPFFIAMMSRSFSNFSWGSSSFSEKIITKQILSLPTKNGEIDFEFMENFVAELEAQRVAELEAHLTITGQKNYILTEEEESALRSYENIEWKKFKLGVLFEKLKTKKLTLKAGQLPKQATGVFDLPSLTSSFRNQGLNYFVPRDGATILKNVISLPSNSDVYRAYYQSQEFTVLSDSYAIDWIFNSTQLSPRQYLFAVSSINKVTDLATYSYKNKLGGWNVVSKKSILLPVKNDEIDFAYMETLISALQKIVIKDVVLYADEKIAATKKIVG